MIEDNSMSGLTESECRRTALADRLAGYASVFEQPCAEACIAANFAAQIRAGNEQIDLTQRYETTDPVKAAVRHARALRNIEVLVQEATQLGLSVNPGHAVAVTIESNRLALQHEPENRLPTPEPARFSF
jgi:pyridoxine 5'-phosphate synthase PdxJ